MSKGKGKRRPVPIKVASDAECEAADYVLCVRLADDPGAFTDNCTGPCSRCGETVIWRPYMPTRPLRICLGCAMALLP
jgi:hypothetical protein